MHTVSRPRVGRRATADALHAAAHKDIYAAASSVQRARAGRPARVDSALAACHTRAAAASWQCGTRAGRPVRYPLALPPPPDRGRLRRDYGYTPLTAERYTVYLSVSRKSSHLGVSRQGRLSDDLTCDLPIRLRTPQFTNNKAANESEYRAGRPPVHMRPHARDKLRRTPGTHGRTAHTNHGRLAPASGQSRPAGGWGWGLKRPRPQPQPQPQRLPGPSRNQTPPWVASQQDKTRKRLTSWGHRGLQA